MLLIELNSISNMVIQLVTWGVTNRDVLLLATIRQQQTLRKPRAKYWLYHDNHRGHPKDVGIWKGRGVKIDFKVAIDKILEKLVDIFYGWSNMNIEMRLHEFLDPIV